ncbi:MAG: MBL fold metallo-hydrolase [Chthoniobacterales bacterium]
MKITQFTGGPCETNCYLVALPEGNLLIDATEGVADYFKKTKIDMLFLTHAHFDHVMDAAKIVREHGCSAVMHEITEELIADTGLLRRYGLDIEIEPLKATQHLIEGVGLMLLGKKFDLYEVPGHCPGSICLHDAENGILYGGDVLFAGGVGRWDLPGGDRDLLLSGIRNKLLPLPPATRVLSGHGPETTIGVEKETNPYISCFAAGDV